ncbi:N-acetylmuramoyl-L-alanine amidase [Campylobacter pinnipediorum subsp. pinnipediorum]|uniref:N-acetylmuramoyl-L-alanine amidase family protein n=1 Tax=Campylobacter pinnipediorum TaxID=1965231 RepID=UPI0009950257|nr:N-acetylmuramoyl-L-alanine amidase [Campylobacter pinnipediorum]AQW81797.1 N-acetylmuramoyl-L-alanine amidase [Campylobacter pinnipediorum subsp. pinnipediorum]OPA79844.1 N-acetylmuramoyl-L-alanine amidase [Campylobacter pinnipediorum subsp. pinnipediorum]
MARFFLVILAFFICAFGANTNEILSNFDKKFNSSSKQVKLQIHNQIKDLYIQSLIKNNNELKYQTLSRLIKSSKALKLNYKVYEDDFKKIKGSHKEVKKVVAKQKQKPISQNKKESLPYLLSATKQKDVLALKFNKNINPDTIKTFSLVQKPYYRDVLDIKAILNGGRLVYSKFLVDEILIAQNNKTTIRMVFRDTKPNSLETNIKDNMLYVGIKSSSLKQSQTSKPNQKVAPASKPKKQKIIVIDPGHGGNDPGAISGKLKEKNAVLEVGKKLGKELEKRGYKVFYTRSKDVFINLRTRTKFANDKAADLFVSIHANAAPNAKRAKEMRGIETFFLSPARSERSKNAAALENKSDLDEMNYFSKETFLNFLNREKIISSNKLGIDMQSQILKSIKSKKYKVVDGGVREAPFWVLVGALMPAVLIEIGYITHPEEGKLLFNNHYQNALATGIANGVDAYFIKNQ